MNCPSCRQENRDSAGFCDSCGTELSVLTPKNPTPKQAIAPSGGFVGRHQEIEELKVALDGVLSGHGRLAMLAGEPGIGKTRTAQELTSFAEKKGFLVWWGRCYEDEGMPPFWPWVQSMRPYLQQVDANLLRSHIGRGAADIAEIIPELRDKLLELEQLPSLEPEQARFRLFDSISAFFKNTAQWKPLVLVLDDLHWADRSSLLLLEFVVREIGSSRLLVVATYRDGELFRQHPLQETLARVSREPVFQRALLQGLGRQDAREFIEATSQIRPSQELVDTIYTHTEGNPFFMAEVIRLLSQGGQLGAEVLNWDQGFKIPDGIREVIGNRLNKLSPECNQTMIVAAVIGREFDFKLLRLLNDATTEEQLLDLLDEAVESRVIEESPGSLDKYQFCHSLIQETLASELSAARRVRLHRRIGETLEDLYKANSAEHASELAFHFDKAQLVAGTEKLVHYSLLAGEQFLATYAYEEALQHFENALAAKLGQPVDQETAGILLGLGRAQDAAYGLPRFPDALENLIRAFDYYVEIGEVEKAVAIAGYPFQFWTEPPPGVFNLIKRGLALVSPESHQAGYLWLSYGRMQGIAHGDYAAAVGTLDQVLQIADHNEDAALEMQTLGWRATVDFFHNHFSECLDHSRKAINIARNISDPRVEANCEFWVSLVLAAQGNLRQARVSGKASLVRAERVDRALILANALWVNQVISQLEGDWDAARNFCDSGLAVWPSDPRILASRVSMEYLLGNFDQGKGYLDRLLEVLNSTSPGPTIEHAAGALIIPIAASVKEIPEEPKAVEAAAENILMSPNATPFLVLMARVGLALRSVNLGDVPDATAYYALLEPSLKGIAIITVSGDRLLGLLSQTMGELDRAAAHFEDALAFCRNSGCRPELAWTCSDYAEVLFHPRATRDTARGLALLEESSSISDELGIQPLSQRITAIKGRLESQSPALPTHPDGLTQREIEVLTLVALGKSNREIADELTISPNTVVSHVSNIFNKIGVANRTEAATYANRHGLLST